jgi:hypothetical protein
MLGTDVVLCIAVLIAVSASAASTYPRNAALKEVSA